MNTRTIGKKGEDIACHYLEKNGFKVVARNYQRKWGEIDIIAQKDGGYNFFEVKSVSSSISRVTNRHRPEDNVHRFKLQHIGRMIETFLFEKKGSTDHKFYFHVLTVYMDTNTRKARVCWLKNIII